MGNTGGFLPKNYISKQEGLLLETEFNVSIGAVYTVYALEVENSLIRFYICDDAYTYYPMWHPAPLFEVIDNRIPSCWRCAYYPEVNRVFCTFEEWLLDKYFYDHLTDRKQEEVALFQKLKQSIDAETS